MKKQKKDKEIKINKGTENEVYNKGSSKGKLIDVHNENGNGGAVDIADRKKKQRDKNKEANQVTDIEVNEGKERLEEENIFEMKRDKNANKEKKQKKDKEIKINKGTENEVYKKGSSKGKLIDVHDENGNGDAVDIADRKKKQRDKNKEANQVTDIEVNEGKERLEEENIFEMKREKKANKEKKSQGVMRDPKDVEIEVGGKEDGTFSEDREVVGKVERKKRKRDRKSDKDDSSTESPTVYNEQMLKKIGEGDHNDDAAEKVKRKKKKKKRATNEDGDLATPLQENVPENVEGSIRATMNDGNVNKKRKRQKNSSTNENLKDDSSVAQKGKKKRAKSVENVSSDATPNKSSKKVRFSDEVEVFRLPDDSNTTKENENKENNLVRGKRFTKKEDDIVKEAVFKYIKERDLGEEGLNMVLNTSKHRQLIGCWKEIATAIPYRPYPAIYFRAQILFRRSENRNWTEEEFEMVRKWQSIHGNDWKPLEAELGKHRQHVKEAWRRIRLPNLKKGHWSQKEYQGLFDLVNIDLQMKFDEDEEKKSKHGMLKDNISWTAISDKLSTRTHVSCCTKWYKQLTSPMVEQGVWAYTDDYRLLSMLYRLDANCMEDVDWDYLLDDKDGDVCRKRWNEMVLHIGHHGNKSFAEQVEVLAQRYCPHLLEAREAWDNKPRVP